MELFSKEALIQSLEEDLLAAQKGLVSTGRSAARPLCQGTLSICFTQAETFSDVSLLRSGSLVKWPSAEDVILLCEDAGMQIGNGALSSSQSGVDAAVLLAEDASTEEIGGQQTMIRVICSQRDRLRERVAQLDDELAKARASS